MPWWLTDLIHSSLTVPNAKALITLCAFLVAGFLILWKNRRDPVLVATQLIVAFTTIRVTSSYWDYHHGFLEGVWPIVWTVFGLIGASLGYNLGRKPFQHDTTL